MLWIAAKIASLRRDAGGLLVHPSAPPRPPTPSRPPRSSVGCCLLPSRASIAAAPAAEMASNKRSRADSSGGGGGRFLCSTGTDGLVCSVCEGDIPYEGKPAELMPCECSLCHECLLEAHAERGSSPLCCPDHGVEVEAHQLFERRLVVKTNNYNLEKKTMGAKETMMKSARQYLVLVAGEGRRAQGNTRERGSSDCGALLRVAYQKRRRDEVELERGGEIDCSYGEEETGR